MANYATLRDSIAGYMHRTPETFYFNGQDLLLRAVNNAKNFAQRAVDFELAKVFCQLNNVSQLNGANIASMVLFGTTQVVQVKKIKRAFLDTTTNVSGGNQTPIDFISRDAYVQRLRRQYEITAATAETRVISSPSMPVSAVQIGQTVFVVPANTSATSITLYFDAVQWIPDFATTPFSGTCSANSFALVDSTASFINLGVRIGDLVTNNSDGTSAVVTAVNSATSLSLNADIFISSNRSYSVWTVAPTQTNFLLDYCFDYMMFRSIWELNYFLKEDMRVQLSDTMMKEIWDNVIRWNETIIGNSVDDADMN